MAAKAAEKLIILGDVCKGLLARVYNLTGSLFQRPTQLNVDVDRITKKLVQKFPEHPQDMDKAQLDLFNQRAPKIESELQDYFLTFVDLLQFDRAAMELLLNLSKNIVAFKFDVNSDLLTHFMDLFTGYVQLHLLVGEIEEAKLMLSAYAYAYHINHGNTEQSFLLVAPYLRDYGDDAWRYIREKCEDLTMCIGDTLMPFLKPVTVWSSPDSLIMNDVFSVIFDPHGMTLQRAFTEHLELLHYDRFLTWSMFGFLACPNALNVKGPGDVSGGELMGACLKTHFVVPVYRDVVISPADEMSRILKEGRFKLPKMKKILKEADKQCVSVVERHAKVRNYLRAELNTLYPFFSEFPQVLSSKFQMVLCALHLARYEIEWYFSHWKWIPHRHKKLQAQETYEDPLISELIHLVDRMSALVMTNQSTIQAYYVEFLRGPDSNAINSIVNQFLQSVKLSHGIQDLLTEIVQCLANASADSNFEAVRLNWYRVSATLNAQQTGIGNKAERLNAAIGPIIVHSRNVDRIVSQVRKHASMKNIFWYRKLLHDMLINALTLTQGQPRYCLSICRVLHQGLENVHRFCPEEQKLIGTKGVATAELFFNAIVTGLGSLMSGISIKLISLRDQTAPIEVVKRREQDAKKGDSGGPLPGYESLHGNRHIVNSLRVWKKAVSEICAAIQGSDRIVVFNTEYNPREWLYQAVSKAFREAVVRVALPERAIQRPTVLLQAVKDLIHVYFCIDRHVNIGLSDIVQHVLFTEFVDERCSDVAAPLNLDVAEDPNDSKNVIIHAMSSWYKSLLTQDLGKMGIMYSDLRSGFVSTQHAQFNAENYADIIELKALVTLCGPHGVRVFERNILKQIQASVAYVHKSLKRNADVLRGLSSHYADRTTWYGHVKKIMGLDECVKHCIIIGSNIKFRQLMYEALKDVTDSHVPFIADAVRNMCSVTPPNAKMDSQAAPLDFLALNCGIEIAPADHGLRLALKCFHEGDEDQALWELLPELLAALFLADAFHQTRYLIETQSNMNNTHCVAAAAVMLVQTFVPMHNKMQSNEEIIAKITSELERTARLSSYSILHMSSPVLAESFGSFDMPSVMVYLEKFILETKFLDLAILEEFFPFTLLRTNHVQMYEKQDRTRSYTAVVDEDEK